MCAETLYLRLVAFMRIIKQIFRYSHITWNDYIAIVYVIWIFDKIIFYGIVLGLMPSVFGHSNKYYAYLFGIIIRNACFNIQIIAKIVHWTLNYEICFMRFWITWCFIAIVIAWIIYHFYNWFKRLIILSFCEWRIFYTRLGR